MKDWQASLLTHAHCLAAAAGGQPAPAGSADPGGPPPYTRAKVLVLLMSAAQQLGDCQLALRLLSCAAGALRALAVSIALGGHPLAGLILPQSISSQCRRSQLLLRPLKISGRAAAAL